MSLCLTRDKINGWIGKAPPPPSLNLWPVPSPSPPASWTSPTLREYYIALILKAFQMGSNSQNFVFSCQKSRCWCGTIKIVTRYLLGFDWSTNTLILTSRKIKDILDVCIALGSGVIEGSFITLEDKVTLCRCKPNGVCFSSSQLLISSYRKCVLMRC